jgi:hypothetical protein
MLNNEKPASEVSRGPAGDRGEGGDSQVAAAKDVDMAETEMSNERPEKRQRSDIAGGSGTGAVDWSLGGDKKDSRVAAAAAVAAAGAGEGAILAAAQGSLPRIDFGGADAAAAVAIVGTSPHVHTGTFGKCR